ncbi:adaptin N terminal region-domain-containing protein [Phyllosticta paracitricarpa]|uniref:Adaptin N terminal region-domain-containing protein n=1 Tax=Phyllosticta paracitricarpa TaxID=2016321 RepID=A0ABR1N3B0_9PEZI
MESISRISAMLETARDLTLEAARDASAARKTSSRPIPAQQLKRLLDSRHEREVLEGLRRIIAMAYRNQPTLPFFSAVIKNIASPSLEIKKLVYIYLLLHAEAEPDTALLSINTIQKSLADSNPQVRALAMRVMSGIRVPVISQIVSLGIKRGTGDMSPYVRKAAALAIPKCYRLDPNTMPQLVDYLSILLGDKQYYVAGAAVAAFLEICPERIDLIHPHYRSLIRKLVDMDEWGQLATLRLMTTYARKCFPRRTRRVKKPGFSKNGTAKPTKGFYDESSEESGDEDAADPSSFEEVVALDPDLEYLLKSLTPLLQSRNSAVVVAVARCYLHLGTPAYLDLAIGPLISLLRSSPDVELIALHNVVRVCMARPEAFVKYTSHFLLRSTDSPQIWRLKLEILTLIFPHSPHHLQSLILAELAHFTGGHDAGLVREAVRAIGRCAQRSSDQRVAARCMRLLLSQISSPDARLVAEALEVVRHLIQRDPEAHRGTVVRLAKNLDTATSPAARASIIWLVGEFASVDPSNNIAADVLRILAKGYAGEAEESKLQILLLAAKVYLQHLLLNPPPKPEASPEKDANADLLLPGDEGGFSEFNDASIVGAKDTPAAPPSHPIPLLYNYILLLTRYDTSYDLRDRARVYRALLAVPSATDLASLLLLAPKPVPHAPSPSESRAAYTLGSASLVIGDEGGVVGTGLRGGEEVLPEWVREGDEPDASLRDEAGVAREFAYGAPKERVVPAGEQLDRAAKESGFGVGSFGAGGVDQLNGAKEKTLDDWLAEDEDDEEEESEEETESEETDEETDDDEEEEEEEDEETESEDDDDAGEGQRLVKE